jgi:trans-aconitate methyltransferase
MPPFSDHFSSSASSYASFRPGYPPALFAWLASVAPDRHRVWDCATGSGQAAVHLANHFEHVAATDASAAQLAHAARRPGVQYAAMSAERCALRDDSASLVTVAQALHWFDQPAFFPRHGLGGSAARDALTIFAPVCNGTVSSPV